MINHNRRKRLLKLVAEHQEVSVGDLVRQLSSSFATVRRDIAWLAERNMLTRKHGSVSYRHHSGALSGLSCEPFHEQLQRREIQKRAIARHASTLCADGDTIIINGGSTTYMMSEFLAARQLRILTNSFQMARALLTQGDHEVLLTAGKVYREQDVIFSPFDRDIPDHHYANRMFMGAYGISSMGLMEGDPLLIRAEQRLIGQAEELVVLADSLKFAHKTGLILCALSRVGCVITDSDAPDASVQMLERAGVRVIVVEPNGQPRPLH